MTRPEFRGAWTRFWFAPQPTSTVAVVRIAVGAVSFLWGLAMLPDVDAFFSTHGIEPVPVLHSWGILQHYTSDTAVHVVYAAHLLGALAVLVGFRTRLASVVLFVTTFSFIERAPSVFNSGDGLLRMLVFFLMFMPAGESLSVDRWLRTRRTHEPFWAFPALAPWGLRLAQI